MLKLSQDDDYLQWGRCMADKQYSKAIQHIEIVLQKAVAIHDPLTIGLLLRTLARTYMAMGQFDLAVGKFEESDIATSGDGRARLDIAKFWYEIHDRPDLALEWVRRIVDKYDFLAAQENTTQINQEDVIRAARESVANLEEIIAEQKGATNEGK